MEKGGSSRRRIARAESPPAASLPFPPDDATAHDDDAPLHVRPAGTGSSVGDVPRAPVARPTPSAASGSSVGGGRTPVPELSARPIPDDPAAPDDPTGTAAIAPPPSLGSSRKALPPISPLGGATIITQPPPPESASSPVHPLELAKALRGEMLDHFLLEESVGIGGMGTVFRAKDTMLNRTVAVKVLARDQAKDSETVRRFRNEAQSAARLDHEHIARVYFMGEARQVHYIVFEFIDGINVRDAVHDGGPLPLDEALGTTVQIASALAHAGGRDVVHRDVKPSNIILTREGKAKLVDMGLARLHELTPHGGDLTASGVTLGTFDYISPEQARDPRQVDVRSDIYSLGCTLYFMLTGRPPFPQGTVFQKLLQHQGDVAPDPRDFDPTLPPEVVRIVRKMMAKDASARHQTPEELIAELLHAAQLLNIPLRGLVEGLPYDPENFRPSWHEIHLPWIVPTCVLLAAVVLLETLGSRPPADYGLLDRAFPLPAWSGTAAATAPPGPAVSAATFRPGGPVGTAVVAATSATAVTSGEASVFGTTAPTTTASGSEAVGTSLAPPAVTGSADPAGTSAAGGETAASGMPVGPGPGTTRPATAPDNRAAGPFRLVSADRGTTGFPSLAAACSAALGGDTIELRFDGRRLERSVLIENKNLTLRAADGFRPILAFQYEFGGGREPATRLFNISGGRMTLRGLPVELHVPADTTAPAWALFRTQGSPQIELSDCLLSLTNPGGQLGAAFFEIGAAPGAEAMLMSNPDLPPPPPAQLRLRNCVIRGDASLVRAVEPQTFDLEWDNGLLVLGQAAAFETAGSSMPPHPGMRNRCNLRRWIGDVRGGLVQLPQGQTGQAPARFVLECEQSILVGKTGVPLIEQSGVYDPAEVRSKLRFEWRAVQVVVENVSVWWRVATMQSQPLDWGQSAWAQFWGEDERMIQTTAAPWVTPPPAELPPVAERTADAYRLKEDAGVRLGPQFGQLPAAGP